MPPWTSQGKEGWLESSEQVCYTTRRDTTSRIREFVCFREGDALRMPKGREKDRKVRKKHRKNINRVKALAKARRMKSVKKR